MANIGAVRYEILCLTNVVMRLSRNNETFTEHYEALIKANQYFSEGARFAAEVESVAENLERELPSIELKSSEVEDVQEFKFHLANLRSFMNSEAA